MIRREKRERICLVYYWVTFVTVLLYDCMLTDYVVYFFLFLFLNLFYIETCLVSEEF